MKSKSERGGVAHSKRMTRAFRLLIGLAALVAGILISLWGLFFVLYRGDEGGGDVNVGDMDAQVAGVIALAVGLTALWLWCAGFVAFVWWSSSRFESRSPESRANRFPASPWYESLRKSLIGFQHLLLTSLGASRFGTPTLARTITEYLPPQARRPDISDVLEGDAETCSHC